MDDVGLLERWRAGDLAAGEALFEAHFDRVVRFFRNKLSEGTDDLVQRTFLACVEGRDRLRADASFRSYLFGVAHNLLRKHFAGVAAEPVDFTARSVFDLQPSPSTVVAKGRAQQLLLEALRRIPLEYQSALELHYWEDLTAAEIADILEVPLGTAKTRLRRGRELLRERLLELTGADLEPPGDDDALDARARALRACLLAT
ncbi:MAG: sigma-70 family RNA polymerase sigma factor [Deltaproteobacteria bacterium]|nr:sigma-70 family RNA polymerase sigma factor [Deltaproteobacteria bacterium]